MEYLPAEYFLTLPSLAALCVCFSVAYMLNIPNKFIRDELSHMAGTTLFAFLLVFAGCFFAGAFNNLQMQHLFHLESVKISTGTLIALPLPVAFICFSHLFITGGKRVQSECTLDSLYAGHEVIIFGRIMVFFAVVATVGFIGVLFAP